MAGPTRVNVSRRNPQRDAEADLRRVHQLAKLLDARFSVAGIRFGYDSIVGLVPVIGDTLTAGLALYPIYLAHRHGLGKVTLARMATNVALDWLVGSVPILGDFFDVAWKANLRNLSLFEKALARRQNVITHRN